ncbi:MAG: ribonuclease HII [Candidatus Nanoarchaeia archaeon]|jgi:ribonuclease HII
MVKICGIDEAGKGPVVGDLIVCGVLTEVSNDFDGLGFDSKTLSPKKREELFLKIKEKASNYALRNVSAKEIDSKNSQGCNLNTLEFMKMAEIINELNADVAYIDCPHPIPEKFKAELLGYLNNKNVKIIAEHKADYKYSIVGAASILAKVTRDAMVKKLENDYNVKIGSGYPADPNTIRFVGEFLNGEHDELDEFVRHSWSTIKSKIDKSQTRLV